MRSGTLPTHQIVGMGEAFRLADEEMQDSTGKIAVLRKRLLDGLGEIEAVRLNGHPTQNYPGIVNVSFAFVEGESLLMALKDMAVSSGSACTSASLEPSYVLRALGVEDELAHSSIRFSIGRYTTEEEIDYVVEQTKTAVSRLREISPLWDKFREGVDLPTSGGRQNKLQSA
jgi:cysteine desulfurase